MSSGTSGEQAGGANNDFQRFASGDNADKVLSASYQNKLIAGIERMNRLTFGPGADVIQFGPMTLKKRRKASAAAASGGSGIYIASLDEVDCVDKTAVGYLMRGPCDEDLPGDPVDIEDALGCFLTGPAELLVGKFAFVVKMSGETKNPYTEGCPYVILNMCCDSFSC